MRREHVKLEQGKMKEEMLSYTTMDSQNKVAVFLGCFWIKLPNS